MSIASMRRELTKHAKAKVLFLDETYVRIGTCQSRTLVARGEQAYVVVEDTDAYAPRYDMIACCSGERVFPPIIFTPEERKGLDVNPFQSARAAGSCAFCPLVSPLFILIWCVHRITLF